jgi:protein-L-isoaspartate O-methyltransferase
LIHRDCAVVWRAIGIPARSDPRTRLARWITTIDIDPETADQARTRLTAAGYLDVHVLAGDGALGDATRAPYDRISSPPAPGTSHHAWWHQLADHDSAMGEAVQTREPYQGCVKIAERVGS